MSELSSVTKFSCPCPKDDYYDVFISFRGTDTRFGFTDNLYRSLLESNVYTFIDADLAGNAINTLFKIIVKSRIAVVVYSESFASSQWCLRELEAIMQRSEEKKMFVLPIFYKVNTQELRNPTENTTKYFDKHIIKYGEGVVEKWKNAVIKIGNISGFPYKDIYGRSEHDFITRDILPKIKKKLGEWEEPLESTINPYSQGSEAEHDVFISFMGKDTRYSLANHLYNALMLKKKKTFMDDQDHLKDETIVFELIQRSKMAVVFFSENYTSSKWCLRELVKILQYSRDTTRQLMVLPIFYEIAPSDLRNQPEDSRITYHLNKHVHDEKSETVQSWKNAIADLGHMDVDGWRYAAGHSKKDVEYFIRDLAEKISIRVDEKMESIRNQEARVLAEEENTHALTVQTDVIWNCSGDVAVVDAEVEGGIEGGSSEMDYSLKRVEDLELEIDHDPEFQEEEELSSNHQQQADDQMVEKLKFEEPSSDDQQQADEMVENLEFKEEMRSDDQRQADEMVENLELKEESSSDDQQQADEARHMENESASSHQNIAISPIPHLRQEDITQSFQHTNTTTGEEEVYHVVTSAYFQKLDEIMGELLDIKPNSLRFYIEPYKPSSSCVILSNKTDSYVAFKIQTMPLKYYVRPREGVILPRSTCQVIVTMDAQSVLPSDMECSDLFRVQSMKVKKNSYFMDNFSDMLTEYSGNTIDEDSMTVAYFGPPEGVSSVSNDYAQLANNGFFHGSKQVISIDTHPTKPWLLLVMYWQSVCIWNYETRAEEKSFKVDCSYVTSANFIHGKNWIVVADRNGFVHVFDYSTSKKLKTVQAHNDSIKYVAVHPTSPYVLTASRDKLVKLWNWENNWACIQTFMGHWDPVVQVAFNPIDSRSFASVSRNGAIQIWRLDLSFAKFMIDADTRNLSFVEYFVGNDDKLYLLTGCGNFIKVWDYDSKTLIRIIEGHSGSVTTSLVHPKLPIIITGSEDKTIRIWNKKTNRLEFVWCCDLGQVWHIKFIKVSNMVVIGCEEGLVVIKIVDTTKWDFSFKNMVIKTLDLFRKCLAFV